MLPGEAFGKFLSLPCEMSLHTVDGQMKLFAYPVRELSSLEQGAVQEEAQLTLPAETPRRFEEPGSGLYLVRFTVDASFTGELYMRFYDAEFVYNGTDRTLAFGWDRQKVSFSENGTEFTVVTDRCSVELFTGGGEIYWPVVKPLDHAQAPLTLEASEDSTIRDFKITELCSLLPWQDI